MRDSRTSLSFHKASASSEEGDELVQRYAVKVDPKLHKEVLSRYSKLDIPPYRGFINPVYTPVVNEAGEITDIEISYPENYVEQMLRLSREYSPLTGKCGNTAKVCSAK